MAKQTLNTIKNWFRTLKKPTQSQFWDTWDSFWHKDENIPASKIEGLSEGLQNKVENETFQSHLSDENAHPHGHEIAGVNGLPEALEGKANKNHDHDINDINGLAQALEDNGPTSDDFVDLESIQDINALKKFLAGVLVNGNLQVVDGDVVISTSHAGTASSDLFRTVNASGGGVSIQKRGGISAFAKGDSVTDYFIYRGIDNTGNEVFRVRQGGRVKAGDGVNADDLATLGQVEGSATALRDGVSSDGDTLKKLYNLITAMFKEERFDNIAQRDAYDVESLPFQAFVDDDGDGKWAVYRAVAPGQPATYIKTMDQDLFSAVITGSQIASAYEGYADVARFTTALRDKLNGIQAEAEVNDTATQILDKLAALTESVVKIPTILFDGTLVSDQFYFDENDGSMNLSTTEKPEKDNDLAFVPSNVLFDMFQVLYVGFAPVFHQTRDTKDISIRKVIGRDGLFYACSSNGSGHRFYISKDGRFFYEGGDTNSLLFYSFDVSYDGRTVILVGRDNGTTSIRRSTDGGVSFSTTTITPTTELTGVVNVAPGRWVACCRLGNVIYSEDDGATWSDSTVDGANSFQGIDFNDGLVVITSNDGTNRVQVSTDFGETFTSYSTGTNRSFSQVGFFYGHIILRRSGSSSGGFIAISNDQGATWEERLLPPVASQETSGMAVIADYLYLFGANGYMIRTKDLQTYEEVDSGTTNKISTMATTIINGKPVVMYACDTGSGDRIYSTLA
jgi:hypothetical protein